jgi:2,3-bisphosphoglycerate-dependent phosphoglycerate mutase
MTTVYFIRHAEPDHSWKDDQTRPLTKNGQKDAVEIVTHFKNIKVDSIYSSPYKRCIDTIIGISNAKNLTIKEDFRLRERKVGISGSNINFLIKRWEDKSFAEENGESIASVQNRNIQSLQDILNYEKNKTLLVGTHGTALSAILNYYDNKFDYTDFLRIKYFMPYIIKLDFDGQHLINKHEEIYYKKRKISS